MFQDPADSLQLRFLHLEHLLIFIFLTKDEHKDKHNNIKTKF